MARSLIVALWMVIFAFCIQSSVSQTHQKLLGSLFQDYNKVFRPKFGTNQPTRVIVFLKILSIRDIDLQKNEFTVTMFLRQMWNDSRLSWKKNNMPQNLNIAMQLRDAKDRLWLPDFFFRNGIKGYAHSLTSPNYLIRLAKDGLLLFSQRITVRLRCPMDARKYPFDSHTCEMNMGSYAYRLSELELVWKDGRAIRLAPSANKTIDFGIESVEALNCLGTYATITGRYPCLRAEMKIKRNFGAFIVTTYLPTWLFMIISWAPYWLPAKSFVARLVIAVISILGVSAQMAWVGTALGVTALHIWLVCSWLLALISLAMVAVMVLLRLREAANTEQPRKSDEEDSSKAGQAPAENRCLYIFNIVCQIGFPIAFIVFNVIYWSAYTN